MDFIPTRRAVHLLLVAGFAIGAGLARPAPAAAQHGQHDNGEGGHDQGRHLGWYKHGQPGIAGPAFQQRSGAWGWQADAIAASAAWGVAWGLGPRFVFFAPPVIFVPAPVYVSLPPVVVSVPWMAAPAPYYAPPPPVVAAPVVTLPAATPEAMLCAALPPPVVVLPPAAVMIQAGPPPLIFSPPAYALSVWPVLFFAPPMLAVAVKHDEWWTTRYRGRGGYYAGGYYASRSYVGGGSIGAVQSIGGIGHAGGQAKGNRGGHQGGGHGHDH